MRPKFIAYHARCIMLKYDSGSVTGNLEGEEEANARSFSYSSSPVEAR